MNEIKNNLAKSDDDIQRDDNITKLNQESDDKLYKDFLNKIKTTHVLVYRSDYYPNSIPLGSFCFAVSFILYGFFESKVHEDVDNFLYLVIFLFGGIGQITAGIFEFIKARTYPASLYILYGIYFLSFFYGKKYNEDFFEKDAQKIFFGSWAFLGAPFIIYSIKINIFYLIQNIIIVAFFVVKCIGICKNSDKLKETVSGILELVAGFCSLYICFGQILNKHFETTILPSIPLKKDNDIDDFVIKREE